jgi:hypothetical protein
MKDSLCAKQAEQEGYMCVDDANSTFAPFYMVASAELPIFA